jgi:hypothetical protein
VIWCRLEGGYSEQEKTKKKMEGGREIDVERNEQ